MAPEDGQESVKIDTQKNSSFQCIASYGMVWYGMVWYGMVWYGVVWYGVVWCSMVSYRIQ